MSDDIDCTAYACIGVKVPVSKLWTRTTKVGCDCPGDRTEAMKFCPTCGTLCNRQTVSLTPAVPSLERTRRESDYCWSVAGLETVIEDDQWSGSAIIAATVSKRRTSNCSVIAAINIATVDLPAMRERMREALTPLGLWDEAAFGLYAVCRVEE